MSDYARFDHDVHEVRRFAGHPLLERAAAASRERFPSLDEFAASPDDYLDAWTRASIDARGLEFEYERALADQAQRHRKAAALWLAACPPLYRAATLDDDPARIPLVDAWFTASRRALTLHLVGPVGVGKTHLAAAVAAEYAARTAARPRFWSIARLLEDLRPGGDDAAWQQASSAQLVILDDLQAANPTAWAREKFLALVDARTSNELRTICTTNAPWQSLVSAWGEPAMDRLTLRSATIEMRGDSRRRPVDLTAAAGEDE